MTGFHTIASYICTSNLKILYIEIKNILAGKLSNNQSIIYIRFLIKTSHAYVCTLYIAQIEFDIILSFQCKSWSEFTIPIIYSFPVKHFHVIRVFKIVSIPKEFQIFFLNKRSISKKFLINIKCCITGFISSRSAIFAFSFHIVCKHVGLQWRELNTILSASLISQWTSETTFLYNASFSSKLEIATNYLSILAKKRYLLFRYSM